MTFLNDRRKYLIVAAMLILAGICYSGILVLRSSGDAQVRETAREKRQDLGLLCGIVDKLVAMDKEAGTGHGYAEILTFAVEDIEANYHLTYAQVFDQDLNPLTALNPGVGGGQKHNPVDYPEFVEAVRANQSGDLVYWYETQEGGGRDIFMTFRWVPTNTGLSERYLVAIGISKYTVNEQINRNAVGVFIAAVSVAAMYITVCTVLIVRLGYIFDQRKKPVWRKEGGGIG